MLAGGDGPPARAETTIRVHLRPGTVGVPFSQPIGPDGTGCTAFACDGAKAIGLTIDPDLGTVGGVPEVAGEHDLRVTALRRDVPVEIALYLIINADPRSLWRAVDPPDDAPHPKPHVDTIRIDGESRLIGASKRGRGHAHGGGFRDDHIGARVAGPWHLLAVADGAGSAALSRLGSAIAVETALTALTAGVADLTGDDRGEALTPVLVEAARFAARALDDRAAADGIDRRALSTTLILAAVRRIDTGLLSGVFAVGDGGAGVIDLAGGRLATLTVPDSGEYAGQTRFLDAAVFDADVAARVRVDAGPATALLLMTDGITDAFLPTDAAYASFDAWAALWAEIKGVVDLADPDALLAWLDFWSHGNHDDRSLLVLIP